MLKLVESGKKGGVKNIFLNVNIFSFHPKWRRWNQPIFMNVSCFVYGSFCLQVDSPTSKSFRLHDRSRFAYTI